MHRSALLVTPATVSGSMAADILTNSMLLIGDAYVGIGYRWSGGNGAVVGVAKLEGSFDGINWFPAVREDGTPIQNNVAGDTGIDYLFDPRATYLHARFWYDRTGGTATMDDVQAISKPGETASLIAEFTSPTLRTLTGETDIDVSAADYTAYVALLTITPAAGAPMKDVYLDLDLSKAVTGFAAVWAAQTIQFQVQRKVDGVNWKPDLNATTVALSGTSAAGLAQRFNLGLVDPTAEVRLVCKVSTEAGGGDTKFPYRLQYDGPTPTITAVAAV